MLKREYYCLVAGLPDLFLSENKLAFNSLKFRSELKQQLIDSDYNLVKYLFLQFDNTNLLNLLFHQNKQFNCHGIYSKRLMEAGIEKTSEIPLYMIQFLKWQKEQETREFNLKAENKLHTLFYEYAFQIKNDFLRNWFLFELNTKNILTALNCNRFKYEIKDQLILIESNPVVNSLLTNNRLKHDFFEEELLFAEQVFRVAESDESMIEKEKSIDIIMWDYLDEETFFHYFTIEKILSYILKLIITERWMKLDAETGKELLNKLVNELKTSYEFAAEFSTVK